MEELVCQGEKWVCGGQGGGWERSVSDFYDWILSVHLVTD